MNRAKEDFSSVGGSSINLGHFKNKQHSQLDFKQSMVTHSTVTLASQDTLPPSGLRTTKFGPGFHRRSEAEIKGVFADENKQAVDAYQTLRASRSQALSQTRLQTLRDHDYRAGYNIINNQVLDNVHPHPQVVHQTQNKQGIKMVADKGLGPEAPLRGRSTLRESEGRFFLPYPSGKNQDYRQSVLCREGINSQKAVSIIQLGKRDLPTYGVIDDQFGKSEYTKNSSVTRRGLYEATVPGQFTPRKVPGHPAGDSQIVKQWTSTIDINNRSVVAGGAPGSRQGNQR